MRRTAIGVATCLAFIARVEAQAPTDFDGDGVSDLTRVSKESDNSLTWEALLSSDGATLPLGSIGTDGDAPIVASWGIEGPQVGVASATDGANTITWSILDGSSQTTSRTFGKQGDLVVSGGDFNGDGKPDGAVVRLVRGEAQWDVSYDLFDLASSTPTYETLTFGQSGDRVFFARMDGGAVDWIGVVRKSRSNRSVARVKNLVTGEVRQYTRLPKFASAGSRPRAFGVRQASGPDLLGFEVISGSATTIRVYSLSGALVGQHRFAGTGQSLVGDFNDGSGFEVAFQGSRESGVFNPVSGEVREAQFLGGTAVDEININAVGSASTPGGNDDQDNDNGNGGGGNGGSGKPTGCSSIVPWPGSHIYKTVGSDHFTDIRRNTIGVILKVGASGPFPQCVSAIDSRGGTIASLGLYERGFGWAARYYAGYGCGISTPLNGSAVASQARRGAGSSKIYVKFDKVCYGPIEASRCVNSSSC